MEEDNNGEDNNGDDLNQKMIKFINDYFDSLHSEGEGQGQPIKIHKSLPRSQKDDHVIISHGRTTNTSRRIPNENRKKEKYIQAILKCLQRLLLQQGVLAPQFAIFHPFSSA